MKFHLTEDELKADRTAYQAFRSKRIGASDAGVITGESHFETPYGLWLKKTGRRQNDFSPGLAAKLGITFEATVRAELELKLDIDFPPQMFVSDLYPFMMASLDGWNDENQIVLEIKSVLGMPTYQEALEGKVSAAYLTQIQHQLWVTGGQKALYYVAKVGKGVCDEYEIIDKVLLEVFPDPEHQGRTVKACLEFWNHIQTDTPPPLTERDPVEINKEDAIKLLGEKTKLIDFCLKEKEHNFYEIRSEDQKKIASLKKNKNGVWVLRKEELMSTD